MQGYYEQLYANKLDNLDGMGRVLERQKRRNNKQRHWISNKKAFHKQKEAQVQMASLVNLNRYLKRN